MKRILLVLVAIVMCFTVVGCSTKTVEGNKEFGKYTGIYKLKNMELRIVHYKDTLSLMLRKDGEPYGNTLVTLEGNKFEDLECEFELKKNIVNVKSKQKEIPTGDYKRTNEYTTKEIYKDYIGDISYIKYNNGIYENSTDKIYTVRLNDDTIKFAYKHKDSSSNLAASKESDTLYTTDLFGDIYELKYNNDTLEFKVNSKDENENELTGKYEKTREMKDSEVIKVFAFEDYE